MMDQKQMQNPDPLPDLQVVPVFNLCLAMYMSKEMMGYPVPLQDTGRLFCLSSPLKSM